MTTRRTSSTAPDSRQSASGGKHLRAVVAALLAFALIAGGIAIGANGNRWFGGGSGNASGQIETEGEDWTGGQPTYTGKKNTDTIDIPGFDVMTFKAGATTQSVNLYNPEQNTCYFRLTLVLADGTRIWQSKLIEPGKGLHEIELSQPLSVGNYEGVTLQYECFSLDDQSQLNGSDITLTLHVIA